jgi:hypothetical protein
MTFRILRTLQSATNEKGREFGESGRKCARCFAQVQSRQGATPISKPTVYRRELDWTFISMCNATNLNANKQSG